MNRRIAIAAGLTMLMPGTGAGFGADAVWVDADAALSYVESCRKPNGAYGPVDQEYTDAAWNFPAVAALRLLGGKVPDPAAVLRHGSGSPHGHAGLGHWAYYHHHRLRALLGDPLRASRDTVVLAESAPPASYDYYASPFGTAADDLFKAGGPLLGEARDANAERLGYHDVTSLHHVLSALRDSGRRPSDPRAAAAFIRRYQAEDGGYANGRPASPVGHVLITYYALESLAWLGEPVPNRERTVAFVRSCRDASGGYRWSRAGGPDVAYTWAALGALRLLDATPEAPEATQAWLDSLQNADGGFGDRPGWRSRLYSSYFAVESLDRLGGGGVRERISRKRMARPESAAIPAGEYGVYQAIFKMPVPAPADLEGLHRRGLHLLGLKSTDFAVAEPLLAEIRRLSLPMDVVLCPEMYPHRLKQFDGRQINHVGNFTLDPAWDAERRAEWQAADTRGAAGDLDWDGYAAQVIAPVRRWGGLAYPEQDFAIEYAYLSYDNGAGGYNAVLAGFNWAPRDFVRVFPWRERHVHRCVPVADVDAHGDLAKWSPQLDTVRTLYLAKGPSYADFREAARAGRVVTAIAEPEGVPSGVSYYGPPAAVEYARSRRTEWQWWGKR